MFITRTRYNTLENERDTLEELIHNKNTEIRELNNTLKQLRLEKDDILKKYRSVTGSLDGYTKHINKLTKELNDIKPKFDSLKESVLINTNIIADERAKNKKLQALIEKIQQENKKTPTVEQIVNYDRKYPKRPNK